MSTRQYVFSAHRTPQDAASGSNPIQDEDVAQLALHYRARYNIRTLVGKDAYSPYTLIRIDVSHPHYPFVGPAAWVIDDGNSQTPFSPHFAHGVPMCNGTGWSADGHLVLGHFLIHIARLLNWDEHLPRGYEGYNASAIQWWRKNINGPLHPDLVYPALPVEDLYGKPTVTKPKEGGFRALARSSNTPAGGTFRKIG
jgi:hypothetical protein